MILFIFLLSVFSSETIGRVSIPIGTIFKKRNLEEMTEVINAMSFAMDSHTSSNRSRDFVLKFYVDKIDTVDAYKLTKVICKQVIFNSLLNIDHINWHGLIINLFICFYWNYVPFDAVQIERQVWNSSMISLKLFPASSFWILRSQYGSINVIDKHLQE